jgi:ankyrin repeat protein
MVRQDVHLGLQRVDVVVQVGGDAERESVILGGAMVSISPTNPLVSAAINDDLEDVKARVLMRAKVNVRDKAYNGMTALHVAVENGNVEMVRFLLEHGARTNIRDFQKRTALMMMDDDAKPELAELLIRYGAKPTLVDKEGNNALMHFAEYFQPDVIRFLLNSGIPIDAKNNDGETALMIAADNDQAETVKALLEAGADANAASDDGKTALERTKNGQVRSLLITYGAVARSN